MKLFFHPSLMHSKAAAKSSDLEKATDRCSQYMAEPSSGRLTADHYAHNSNRDRERARHCKSSKKNWRYCPLLSPCCPLLLRIAVTAYGRTCRNEVFWQQILPFCLLLEGTPLYLSDADIDHTIIQSLTRCNVPPYAANNPVGRIRLMRA
jgi:hypothetical protein